MTDRSLIRLAWSLCGVVLALISLTLLLIILGWSTPLPGGWTLWRDQAVSLVGVIGAPILGGLIASRRPRNPYGWLWLGFALGLTFQQLSGAYSAYALVVEPGTLLAPKTISQLLGLGGPVALSLAPFLLLLFPTGRLPSRRWRILAWILIMSEVVFLALSIFFGSPDQVGGAITVITFVVVSMIFATVVLSALSLVVRYRRASGVERQQLKWFALAAVLVVSNLVGILLGLDRLLGGALSNVLEAAANTGLYVAVGFAILKHRLYDIDVIINRTLVYGALTLSLVMVYIGCVVSLQYVFRALTGGNSQLVIVASTLAIAALFNPLRRRIQDFIDRRFYRRKYNAAKTLEAFSARLRDETDLDDLGGDLVAVTQETVQPVHVSLWMRDPEHKSGEMVE
ncbi:MAG: hypothetical protein M3Q75_12960 [Gemmatimonadota bacterium]|nr:hypothetical protein [Gemmatimonadota bacterium]